MNLEQFEIMFMLDSNPEREVAAWERIGAAYKKVAAAMPTVDKTLVLKTLLSYSMGTVTPAEQAEHDIREIIEMAEKK